MLLLVAEFAVVVAAADVVFTRSQLIYPDPRRVSYFSFVCFNESFDQTVVWHNVDYVTAHSDVNVNVS